jgi:hypothetical protein
MNGAILTYAFGFACVWAVVALWCASMAGLRHFTRDWDRALRRELERDRLLLVSEECRAAPDGRRSS